MQILAQFTSFNERSLMFGDAGNIALLCSSCVMSRRLQVLRVTWTVTRASRHAPPVSDGAFRKHTRSNLDNISTNRTEAKGPKHILNSSVRSPSQIRRSTFLLASSLYEISVSFCCCIVHYRPINTYRHAWGRVASRLSLLCSRS